jgi:hypothetical protein
MAGARRQQALRVRATGRANDGGAWPHLDDAAAIRHGDAVGDLHRDSDVVGHEDHCKAQFAL